MRLHIFSLTVREEKKKYILSVTLVSKNEDIFKSIPLINLFELLSYWLSDFFQDLYIQV